MQEYFINAEPPSEKYCREKLFFFSLLVFQKFYHLVYILRTLKNFFSQKWEFKSF